MPPGLAQASNRAVDGGLVVPFDLAGARGVEIVDRSEAAAPAVEQDDLAVGAAEPQHAAAEHGPQDRRPGAAAAGFRGGDPADFLHRLRWQALVGIDEENEIVAHRRMGEAPLLLLGIAPVPAERDQLRGMEPCEGGRVVTAFGIHYEDLREPAEAGKAVRQHGRRVAGHHDHGRRYGGRRIGLADPRMPGRRIRDGLHFGK